MGLLDIFKNRGKALTTAISTAAQTETPMPTEIPSETPTPIQITFEASKPEPSQPEPESIPLTEQSTLSQACPEIKTAEEIVRNIYCYETPGILSHIGWVKIGDTTQDDVEKRIKQQTHTADVDFNLLWYEDAICEDGVSGFRDKKFHRYLKALGYEYMEDKNNEWFRIDGHEAQRLLHKFKTCNGEFDEFIRQAKVSGVEKDVEPYVLREEQGYCVNKTFEYFKTHKDLKENKFLWNAKPRFGKTLSAYSLIKKIREDKGDLVKVLVLSNRPAVFTSWYADYNKFIGNSEYRLVSNNANIKNQALVFSREEFIPICSEFSCIELVSLQDLKGARIFGGFYDKLSEVASLRWDLVIVDESHEGVETLKADEALKKIDRDYTLYLSGTPFKALANEKFSDDAIFNWTYVDEQAAKQRYAKITPLENPYEDMPTLNLYTYQMSEMILSKISQGTEINGASVDYAFDLNEFFLTDSAGKFVHDEEVDAFLDTLSKNEKYPFSTKPLREELRHTLWLLSRVASAEALAEKLKKHPVFENYTIISAVGNSDYDEEGTKTAFEAVTKAIKENDKTITLSVGQLTTGVTIPEWSGCLILSNIESPSLYMQTAFRTQNPHEFLKKGKLYRKENAYVFDFNPERTLDIFEQMSNGLYTNTTNGLGNMSERERHIKNLLNFFPVIGEDQEGKMVLLDASQVLSIPRKIRCREVVNSGFMSNFLFNGLGHIFRTNQTLEEILNKCKPVKEPAKHQVIDLKKSEELTLDNNGEVQVTEEQVKIKKESIFGEKIYDESDMPVLIDETDLTLKNGKDLRSQQNAIQKKIEKSLESVSKKVLDTVTEEHAELTKTDANNIKTANAQTIKVEAYRIASDYTSKTGIIADKANKEKDKIGRQIDEEANREKERIKKEKEMALEKIKAEADRKKREAEAERQRKLEESAREAERKRREAEAARQRKLLEAESEKAKKRAEKEFEAEKNRIEKEKKSKDAEANREVKEILKETESLQKQQEKEVTREAEDSKKKAEEKAKEQKHIENARIDAEAAEDIQKAGEELNESIGQAHKEISDKLAHNTVRQAEEASQRNKKKEMEENIEDHLRGFARTIPTFLMAYGNKNTTLRTFTNGVDADDFKNVTNITLEEFHKLLDANIFNEEVFEDSVKEFFRIKEELNNYYEEDKEKDIFSYIPPQKTNLIYTPKAVVSMMCNMLEEENPGCFDDPDKTFIDIYMKSGLYLAEIVKRLYRSKKMQELYPDKNKRLQHIFSKQIYGLAPTVTIYNIVKNYVLGFDVNGDIIGDNHNIRQFDSAPSCAEKKLPEDLNKIFNL